MKCLDRPITEANSLSSGNYSCRQWILPTLNRRNQRFLMLAVFCLSLALLASAPLRAQDGPSNGAATGPISSTAAIVLDRHGCVPGETVVLAGYIAIAIINRTGFDSIRFHIRPAGNTTGGVPAASLLDFTMVNRLAKHHHVLDLAPGSYQLDLDSHREWKCSITVN
jgi:hypothetical protein